MNIKHKIENEVKRELKMEVKIVEPKDSQFGDYSTPVAFSLASSYKKSPSKIAEEIATNLKFEPNFIQKIDTKDGFINFWLNKEFVASFLNQILSEKDKFGSSNIGRGKRVLVEFVSANPTGPLVVANGRAAVVGDSLVRILNFTGYRADSEYYVDDYGRQIELLEKSIKARYMELEGKKAEIPEDGYPGEYIKEIAKQIKKLGKTDFRKYGIEAIIKLQKATLKRLGVCFNNWVYESKIRERGGPERVIAKMAEKKLTYKKDGALWLKMPSNKDKVLKKSNGEFTYRVPDIAYHLDKFDRGYELLIDLFGPDQSHIPELKFGLSICGVPKDVLKVVTIQWVTFIRGGKKVSMSKRKGEFVTLDELLDEIGEDVARFFFLTRKCDSHLDFDIELAKTESKENPVYYIQYATARISSILRLAQTKNINTDSPNLLLLKTEEEDLLMRKLIHFPEIVEQASTELAPHYIPFYLLELATLFHNFYEKHKVVSSDIPLTRARLLLIKAVRQVISNGLSLIGIKAPERM
jgi:arginyl-tRNA synthetase